MRQPETQKKIGRLRAVVQSAKKTVVSDVGDGVVKIASLDDGQAVAVKKGRVLASSFHPELTTDTRMHSLFVELAREGQIDNLNPTRNAEEISNTV